ncbi:MAG TPA: hypothetical protein PLD05_10345, partial [Thermogutta sp.]|nr:hypothetical protein [Thermogutta sp.]
SIPTFACPHPNPLREGEGSFWDGPLMGSYWYPDAELDGVCSPFQRLPESSHVAIDTLCWFHCRLPFPFSARIDKICPKERYVVPRETGSLENSQR